MKWLRLCSACCVLSFLFVFLSVTAYAVSEEMSSVYEFDDVVDESTSKDILVEYEDVLLDEPSALETLLDAGEPIPVVVLEEEASYSVRASSGDGPLLVIGTEPPADPLFYGSCWVTGTDSNLGTVTLYFPSNYQTGYWGIDSNGYLYNVSSSSLSGYLSGVYNNSVSAQAFSYPRYRVGSGNSYEYVYLYLTPENSNIHIAVDNLPKYEMDYFQPYILLTIGGFLLLCYMKRS